MNIKDRTGIYPLKDRTIFIHRKSKIKAKNNTSFYEVYCSNCHKDSELYPEPFLKTTSNIFEPRSSVIKDTICNCKGNISLSEAQINLISSRIATQYNCEFQCITSESKIFSKAKVSFKNSEGITENMNFRNIYLGTTYPFSGRRAIAASKVNRPRDIIAVESDLITKLASIEGTYSGIVGNYKNNNSDFSWVCSEGHSNIAKISTLLFKGGLKGGCPICNPLRGFDRNKPAHFYIVRWFGYGESYIKFGITNREVMDRISAQDNASDHLDYEILHTFYHESGQRVWDCERLIKSSMQTGVCPRELLPDGYTETIHDTKDNLNLLLSVVYEYLNKEETPQ